MHPNYEYLIAECKKLQGNEARILDYGCGDGKTVEAGINKGFDIYGVEAFAFGSGTNIKDILREKGLLNRRVFDLNEFTIPFPDRHFDLVISNQVFEHIVDLSRALREINRVLKDGGKLLCMFPSMEVIKEGHCGVIFAHRFPYSKFRYFWLLTWRTLGFGRTNRRRTNREWAAFFNEWLRDHVSYRKLSVLRANLTELFTDIQFRESDYLRFRFALSDQVFLSRVAGSRLTGKTAGWLYSRWAGSVILASKNGAS